MDKFSYVLKRNCSPYKNPQKNSFINLNLQLLRFKQTRRRSNLRVNLSLTIEPQTLVSRVKSRNQRKLVRSFCNISSYIANLHSCLKCAKWSLLSLRTSKQVLKLLNFLIRNFCVFITLPLVFCLPKVKIFVSDCLGKRIF